jgi:YD repeat-containing protein
VSQAGNQQTLTWDAEGRLAWLTEAGTTTASSTPE